MSKFIQYYKRLDANVIRKDKEDRIKEALWNYETVNEILPILKEWTGKKITKHIVNDINKKTGLNAQFVFQYGMYHIKINKPDFCKNESDFSLLIGYDTNPFLESPERMDYYAQCYILEKERAENMKKGLERLPEMCLMFNNALNEIKRINEEAKNYDFEYDFDIDSKYLA